MGMVKNSWLEWLDLLPHAEEIAVQAGVLKRCPVCEKAFDPIWRTDVEAAYRLVNRMITDGDELAAAFGSNRRQATDAIKYVVEEAAMECDCGWRWERALAGA